LDVEFSRPKAQGARSLQYRWPPTIIEITLTFSATSKQQQLQQQQQQHRWRQRQW